MPEEIQKIYEIKHNTTDEAILNAGILESFLEAKFHYDRLSEELRKEFDSYPISNLWTEK